MNAIERLSELGQSVWCDNLRRALIDSGELKELIDQGIRGIVSSPSVFERVVAGSADYDRAIEEAAAAGRSVREIYESLVVKDVQQAADQFHGVYEQSDGADGYVSVAFALELSPDVEATVREAMRLWAMVERPNVMMKVPATGNGLEAVERLISSGVNVDVTMLFSVSRYQQAVQTYRRGLRARLEQGLSIEGVASVASLSVSRIDLAVGPLLEQKGEHDLLGTIAVAHQGAAR
jgi:transaldolase